MITKSFLCEEEWLETRLGKITGSKRIRPKKGVKPLIGYYQLISDKLALPPTEERAMDRGNRLEEEAALRFSKETGKKVDTSLVLWMREDNENIAYSPDAMVGSSEVLEIKCLNSAAHIEALLTNKIPTEYKDQVLQAFVVNDKLKTLYFVFYDPRLSVKDFFFITIQRKEIQEDVEKYLEFQRKTLEEVSEIVNQLSF